MGSSQTISKPKRVLFSLYDPQAGSVFLAGDFNGWNVTSHPLRRDKKGNWKLTLLLRPGIYEYNFYVDGVWRCDPNCTETIQNPFGTFNSLLRIP